MKNPHVHPFYFPSNILLVDDDQDFLELFSLRLDEEFNYLLYTSPKEALRNIHKASYVPELITTWVNERAIRARRIDQSDMVMFDLPSFEDKLDNTERFNNVSVVVVDYQMPELNGLEFCRELNASSHIKKILLTGQADESLAVEGFNEGVIDFFLRKDDPQIQDKLNQAIHTLQHAYFDSISLELATSPELIADSCLTDIHFTEYFRQICSDNAIIEYYFLNSPKRFLLIDSRGQNHILRVCNEDDIRNHHEIASDQGAPYEFLKQLSSHQIIPAFQTSHGYYSPEINWQAQVLDAESVKGEQNWYCALDLNTHTNIPDHIVSYQEFSSRSNLKAVPTI